MGLQRIVECPNCGEQWTVECGIDGCWYYADKCPKCGRIVLKIK